METVTKSYGHIMRFVNHATAWQQQTYKNESVLTGFGYAIQRVLKSTAKAVDDYNENVTEINIDTASADEKGNILSDSRGATIFSKEGSKNRNKRIRELTDKEVEIKVYFAKVIPTADLTPFQIAAFEGFVIPEIEEPVSFDVVPPA